MHMIRILSIEGGLIQVPTLEMKVLHSFIKPYLSGLLTSEVRKFESQKSIQIIVWPYVLLDMGL